MIFASDRPGGQGGVDLWLSRKVNGTWSQPENMGPTVNTAYNDVFPTLWKDSVLYYSSEGRHGLGGLDLYRAEKAGSSWNRPENVGYPLNTSFDDFGIAVNDSATGGSFPVIEEGIRKSIRSTPLRLTTCVSRWKVSP